MSHENLLPREESIVTDDTYWALYAELYRLTRSEELVRWQITGDLDGISAREIAEMSDEYDWGDGGDTLRDFAAELVIGTLNGQREVFIEFADRHNNPDDEYQMAFPDPIEDRLGAVMDT